jgi:hypothetical protein
MVKYGGVGGGGGGLRFIIIFWSERSACAAHVVLQTGCMANVVATIYNVIFSSIFSPALLLFEDFYLT